MLHAEFALACALDERMAATARAVTAHIAVAVHIAVAARIAVAACLAACLTVLARAFALLAYFSGLLVCRALPLRKTAFWAQ